MQLRKKMPSGSGEVQNQFKDGGRVFPIGIILKILMYKSFRYFVSSFKSNDLPVQEKKFKTDFRNGGNLGFPVGRILADYHLQIIPILPTKFQVNWSFG